MKLEYTLGLLIIGILIVSGCSPQVVEKTEYVCPDGSIVSNPSYCKEQCKDETKSTSISCSTTNPCKIQFDTRYGEGRTYHQECRDGYCVNIITCK